MERENLELIVKAEYTDQILEEYKNSPLIEALPPIYSDDIVIDKLTIDPGYNDAERQLDAHYRYHCIQRLFKYFQPLETHIDIEQRVSRAIRQGYLSRNPLKKEYVARLQEGYKLIKAGSSDFESTYTAKATASGFTIIGISGVGKTTAVEKVLSLYPQVIAHSKYKGSLLSLYQLTWLKIDCPFDGSLKGLCVNFFHEIDRLLGTNYVTKFVRGMNTVDTMLPRMAQIASIHCLGVLVIDEIQHLSLAKSGGSDKMLNFFVTLVNTIGVPVILIGTTKAMSILQGEFRQARRGSGQGDLLWDRMKNDLSWDIILKAMWKNQWTKHEVPLTHELENALYEESQGIIDIAVKLYAMAQMKAIGSGNETITPSTIKEVANEKLQLVKPMLEALKTGDIRKIAQYADIRPINIEDFIKTYENQVRKLEEYDTPKNSTLAPAKQDRIEQAVLKLLELDIDPKTAKKSVEKALNKGDPFGNLTGLVKEAFKIALNLNAETSEDSGEHYVEDTEDLTKITSIGQEKGQSNYTTLGNNGMIKSPADEF